MLKIQQLSINNKKSSRNVADSLLYSTIQAYTVQYCKIEFIAEQARLINVKPLNHELCYTLRQASAQV